MDADKKMAIIGGLDFSVSCPSVCIYNMDEDVYHIHSWMAIKSLARKETKSNNFYFTNTYIKHDEDYSFVLADSITDYIKKMSPDMFGVEEYAFGASGKLTVLAECLGVVKYNYYKHFGKKMEQINIGQGKMCVNEAMAGNAGKITNMVYFITSFVPNLLTDLNLKVDDATPLTDWVDSWGIQRFVYYIHQHSLGKQIPKKIQKSIEGGK